MNNIFEDRVRVIALNFLSNANPDNWNGTGDKPESFNAKVYKFALTEKYHLCLCMLQEKEGWCHKCMLYEQSNLIEVLTGYGIDSILNILDTIMDATKELYRGGSLYE